MLDCGDAYPDVQFIGIIGFAGAQYFEYLKKSEAFDETAAFIPDNPTITQKDETGWEIICTDENHGDRFNRIPIDCNDNRHLSAQLRTAWLTIVTRGNLAAAKECDYWLGKIDNWDRANLWMPGSELRH